MKRLVSIFFLFLMVIPCYSQKTKKVSAEYTYFAPETMSVEEAKRTALERAKIQAIADEFGTLVSQSTSTLISNKNGETDTQFFSFGGTDAKGEWIETIGEPVYDISYEDKFLIVTCSVKGIVREITSAVVEFIAKTLRNGVEEKFESTSFNDGDDIYLYFKSAINGFLAVYLLDEAHQTVYCILPYKFQGIPAIPIAANEEYIFFSRKNVKNNHKGIVDEYTLYCEAEKEYNTLYLLFSPTEIGKQIGFDGSFEDKPNYISYKYFKQWLSKTLSRNMKIQFKEINITISKL